MKKMKKILFVFLFFAFIGSPIFATSIDSLLISTEMVYRIVPNKAQNDLLSFPKINLGGDWYFAAGSGIFIPFENGYAETFRDYPVPTPHADRVTYSRWISYTEAGYRFRSTPKLSIRISSGGGYAHRVGGGDIDSTSRGRFFMINSFIIEFDASEMIGLGIDNARIIISPGVTHLWFPPRAGWETRANVFAVGGGVSAQFGSGFSVGTDINIGFNTLGDVALFTGVKVVYLLPWKYSRLDLENFEKKE